LSNHRRAPAFAEQGETGEEQWFNLELKLEADVALIGFPNVGKSTLIARVSAARPKIADYPFTTLVPNLGVVRVGGRSARRDAATEFVMADIPGLIEGAATGRGLGHDFLRHVERARVLCVLLDLSELAPMEPEEQLAILLRELGDYQADLLERPRVVVGSKGDVAATEVEGVRSISAITGEGVDELMAELALLVVAARTDEAHELEHEIVVHKPLADDISVHQASPNSWVIEGRPALRAVRFQDLTDDEALAEIVARLRALGVDRMLTRAGVRDGDTVSIGPLSFEWWRDEVGAGLDRGDHHRATRRERLARHGRLDLGDDDD
jgi:GTP-binding protein